MNSGSGMFVLIDKFLGDFCEEAQIMKDDIGVWAMNELDDVYYTKFYFFNRTIKLYLVEVSKKAFEFDWKIIEKLYKDNPKRFQELREKNRKANEKKGHDKK